MFDEQLHGGRLDSGPGTFGLGHPIMLVTNIMGFKPPRWVRWRAIDDNQNVRLSNLVSVGHAQAADRELGLRVESSVVEWAKRETTSIAGWAVQCLALRFPVLMPAQDGRHLVGIFGFDGLAVGRILPRATGHGPRATGQGPR
jgi:hypothetical protein